MEEQKKVQDSLKQLLLELKKVKELNNLANEYKLISSNLILSLQDYLEDGRAFSDAFNNYLSQTNKTVEETKDTLNNAVNSFNELVQTISVADGTIDEKMDAMSVRLSQLEQQASQIECLYNKGIAMEQQVKEDTQSFITDTANTLSNQNNLVIDKIDALISTLKTQISQANQPFIEKLNTFDDKLEVGIEQRKQLNSLIQNDSQQISERISMLNSTIQQNHCVLQQGQVQLQEDSKEISVQINTLHNDLAMQIGQSKNNLISSMNSNESSMRQHANRISGMIANVQLFQKIAIGLLAIIIILVIIIIMK